MKKKCEFCSKEIEIIDEWADSRRKYCGELCALIVSLDRQLKRACLKKGVGIKIVYKQKTDK